MRIVSTTRAACALVLIGALAGCATLQQYLALRQVDFSLDRVADARLADVPLARIASFRDLTASEAGRLIATLAAGTAPLEFTVEVGASNPADNRTDARLTRLEWLLLLDDRETVRGVIDSTHVLPAGQPVTIPVRVNLDMMEFFSGSAEQIVNLAAGLVGLRGDPTRITLELLPRIETPLGSLTPPQPIRVSGSAPAR